MQFTRLVNDQHNYFQSHITKTINWRIEQLTKIKQLVIEHEQDFLLALKEDLAKPFQESWLVEVSYVVNDINHCLKHLNKWLKPHKVSTPITTQPGKSFIQAEPLGTVLIIGAWNYPMQLILAPLVAVISAGNCAVLKPSELAPATANLLAKLIPLYLDKNAIKVILGGVTETTELLKCKFDHIMYTGNSRVAKIVMTAAAQHLTPVTLELGGKSPTFVDNSANLTISAQRIAWGKWLNCGQTCIAPDYVLLTEATLPTFLAEITKQIKLMFGDDAFKSDSYGRLINHAHTKRLQSYLNDQTITFGGEIKIDEKYISPTIVVNPAITSVLMTEEIFGPILPIVVVKDFDAAKQFILSRDKPLAAYLFTKNKIQEKQWNNEISAGSIGLNDVMMFAAVPDLPFGGVGASGMGRYCGKAGFDNFSHLKAVIKRPFMKEPTLRFAPYSTLKVKFLKLIR